MGQNSKIDHYHRFISILDNKDECLFVIPTAVLKQSMMEIGDEFIVLPRRNSLIIKKIKRKV
ncbi:hypothetical protein ET33_35430 [Paenibacillus tyrfis]|uniref:SpoVT-AbrB domain-containing protein n=1 Tax=Paenibacillus tyrfis TaxID=1501230 RepID=A0A081NT03_9BACL|nr:hypothetical protein ET33_35430 [Paenibacillus tyrfis]